MERQEILQQIRRLFSQLGQEPISGTTDEEDYTQIELYRRMLAAEEARECDGEAALLHALQSMAAEPRAELIEDDYPPNPSVSLTLNEGEIMPARIRRAAEIIFDTYLPKIEHKRASREIIEISAPFACILKMERDIFAERRRHSSEEREDVITYGDTSDRRVMRTYERYSLRDVDISAWQRYRATQRRQLACHTLRDFLWCAKSTENFQQLLGSLVAIRDNATGTRRRHRRIEVDEGSD